MSLRTPSKIVEVLTVPPFFVRFVTHGGAIKYSNIIKNLNAKPLTTSKPIPLGQTSITSLGYTSANFIGFTSHHDLIRYPNINKGSMFQLIDSLPPSLVLQMIIQAEAIQEENVIMQDRVVLTLFVYELE